MPAPMAAAGLPGNPSRGEPAPLAVLVAGPTCSGKSAWASALAKAIGGTIINADSMQIYRELRIITARPSEADEAAVPHRLYGVRPAREPGSVAWWRAACLAEMRDACAAGSIPILCGGTGLYFAAITRGLSDIPDPGEPARAQARALLHDIGPAALHARLAAADPATAAKLRPADGQRLARAWEVLSGTGKGLAAWHLVAQMDPRAPYRFKAFLIDPPRAELRCAIAVRVQAMIGAGAIEEVRALLAANLDPAVPAMRAHGVPEISAYLQGELTLAQTAQRICLVTGQYTKRQATWFRHRSMADPGDTQTIVSRMTHPEQLSTSQTAKMQNFLLMPS